MGTYGLRVPASHVGYVPEAQGGLPPGTTYCTYWVHVPASGVGYVPRTVAPQDLTFFGIVFGLTLFAFTMLMFVQIGSFMDDLTNQVLG